MAAAKKPKKPYRPSDRIIARHPETGEQYGVSGAAFEKGFAPRGYEAVSYEDGTAFPSEEENVQEQQAPAEEPATDESNKEESEEE